jgi:Branched-chain amino acid transport protein (AzlD)
MTFAALEHASGGLWPYLMVIVVGFLPTEFWRVVGVLVSGGIDEKSEILVWVRLVASALVAGVVAKLLVTPSGALAFVPLWCRFGALALGLAGFWLFRRSVIAGLIVGEVALILLTLSK